MAVPGWDAMVMAHPQSSFFHGSAWARVLSDSYGFKPRYLTLTSERHLNALLPLMEIDSVLTGRRGVSLPFTDFCEPLSSELFPFPGMFQELIEYGQSRHWKYVECRGGQAPVEGAPSSLAYYGHELELIADETRLFAGFHDGVRRAIRKAQSSGLSVEVSGTEAAVRTFYRLHCRTRRKHGLPPQPFTFFRNIQRHVLASGQGIVVLAKLDSQPVAAAVFFLWGNSGHLQIRRLR